MVDTVTARDDYAKLDANTSGPSHQGQTSQEAQAALDEIDRLRALMDPEVTCRDLEMKMRDGRIDLRLISDPHENRTAHAAAKFLAALMLRFLYDDDAANPPPNYRSGHIRIKPAGHFDEYECAIEVRMPRGRSSHDIRVDLEDRIARARDIIQTELSGAPVGDLLDLLDIAPPQSEETS